MTTTNKLPELPAGMYWSAGYSECSVMVYLNFESSDPRDGSMQYYERRDTDVSALDEDGLTALIVELANAVMARVDGDIKRNVLLKRVSARLGDMPIMHTGYR